MIEIRVLNRRFYDKKSLTVSGVRLQTLVNGLELLK